MYGTPYREANYIYIYTFAGTFNTPTSYQSWAWEREAHINWSIVTCQGSTRSELSLGLLTLSVLAIGSERHRYAIAWPDKLGTDPMAYDGFE